MKGYLGETVLESYDGTAYEGFTEKAWAIEYLRLYGSIDGDHHKQWVMDQVIRILKGTPVILKIAKWANGHSEYRFNTGEPSKKYLKWVEDNEGWEEGIAP